MNTKPLFAAAVGVAALAVALLGPMNSRGQAGGDDAVLALLLTEVVAQQTAISDNQAKIDEKLAVISENLRIARIYVGRGGGKAGGQ